MLNDTDVKVRYDPGRKALIVNRPGWWVINYPLNGIEGLEGKPADDITRLLFDQPSRDLRNWYVKTPGAPSTEPPPPSGPAPINLTPQPTIIVNTQHDRASDRNSGTAAAPGAAAAPSTESVPVPVPVPVPVSVIRRMSAQYPTPATVPITAHNPHSHPAPHRSMTTPDISGATSAATDHDIVYMPW